MAISNIDSSITKLFIIKRDLQRNTYGPCLILLLSMSPDPLPSAERRARQDNASQVFISHSLLSGEVTVSALSPGEMTTVTGSSPQTGDRAGDSLLRGTPERRLVTPQYCIISIQSRPTHYYIIIVLRSPDTTHSDLLSLPAGGWDVIVTFPPRHPIHH